MRYIATLPMYDWPETREQTQSLWNDVAGGLGTLDAELLFPSSHQKTIEHWHSPKLIFSQTCWGPLKNGLLEYVEVLAQSDYSKFLGGRKEYYRSVIVAHENCEAKMEDVLNISKSIIPIDVLKNKSFAFNQRQSLSGFIALEEDLDMDLSTIFSNFVESGSHRNSIKLIADKKVDFAAIDCRSWAMALEHEPKVKHLKVIGWTWERLGLPYVCSRRLENSAKSAIKQSLNAMVKII